MRSWPAEICQHAIAHEVGNVAPEAGNLTNTAVLVASDDLTHLLRVEAGRQRGRADEITEHHCQLPTLSTRRRRECRRVFRNLRERVSVIDWRRGGSVPQFGYRVC